MKAAAMFLFPVLLLGQDITPSKVLQHVTEDQKRIWLFPAKLMQAKYLIPAAAVVGVTAGLFALDPIQANYFKNTSSFNGFNKVFSNNNSAYGTVAVPALFLVTGLARHDSKAFTTGLLAAEAVADSEIVSSIAKKASGRGLPSGHAMSAFAVATVVSRRYGNHKWVPYVAYGLAGAISFSRVTESAHAGSDVFAGGALGYSVARFAVLR